MTAALLLPLSSCLKDKLHDSTHPDTGLVTVTADWSILGEDEDVPERWTVCIGEDYVEEETGSIHVPDCFFEPGVYRIVAYNTTENISVTDTVASVLPVAGSRQDAGTFVSGQAGQFFTYVRDTTVMADCDYSITATFMQQTRELRLIIGVEGDTADKVSGISGYISGVAGTLDFKNGICGAPSSVEMDFTRIEEGDNAGKWAASVWLLGIAGDEQTLKGNILFEGENPAPMPFTGDLTDDLADFNTEKTVPAILTTTISDTPVEGDVEADLGDWDVADGGNVDAN